MVQRGLLPDFSAAVEAETRALSEPIVDQPGVFRDLRNLLWSSIDNDDSRDLDQLSVVEPMTTGAVKVLIAVADVDATVKMNAAIDEHARVNTTSVYTPAEIFPMLPERLSTDLTSLGEGKDRLAMVTEMYVLEGRVISSDVYRARVRNHAKLAYNGVAAWLAGAAPPSKLRTVPGLDKQLRMQDRIAQEMKALRHKHGALSLQTTEARAIFEDDVLSDLRVDPPNRAKELIEDFMIAANGVTANFLKTRGFPSLRRVLRSPERWERIVALAAGLGETLPHEPSAVALEQFLDRRRRADAERFADLSLSVLKLLGRGEYVLQLPTEASGGHFGLAVSDYTHSTAPNRRFADLVTQRLLKSALSNHTAPYTTADLGEIAQKCTDQADNAAKVERQVRKSAAALLLASRIGERFDGTVTGASEKGTWVRVCNPVAEGKVVHGSQGLDVGDHVRVQLIHTDVERGFIDFSRIDK
jgi:exoribonuclease-2